MVERVVERLRRWRLQRQIQKNAMCGGMLVLAISRNNLRMYPTDESFGIAVRDHEATCPRCIARRDANRRLYEMDARRLGR